MLNPSTMGLQSFIRPLLRSYSKCMISKSTLFHAIAYLEPSVPQSLTSSIINLLEQIYPVAFNKPQVKLKMREFMIDGDIDRTTKNAVEFWLQVMAMKSPMGLEKYLYIATLLLQLLIPVSNADSEHVFSMVRRIKTVSFISITRECTISNQLSFQQN